MRIASAELSTRKKSILAGLYLSKFDKLGLGALGFDGFSEAYNAIGYALNARPQAIKNYRDEFDPQFPNERKGWHKRPLRAHCVQALGEFGQLDLDEFAQLIRSFAVGDLRRDSDSVPDGDSAFAKRLITGLAAENYFQAVRQTITQFADCALEDTTKQGCGYDFRLWPAHLQSYIAVEVKGMRERTGSLQLTQKEYESAGELADRYFLFVVKNFREVPFHQIHQNPLGGQLAFNRNERVIIQVSWHATV